MTIRIELLEIKERCKIKNLEKILRQASKSEIARQLVSSEKQNASKIYEAQAIILNRYLLNEKETRTN